LGEKANASRWNFRFGGAILTGIPGRVGAGCEWPTATKGIGRPPSGAIATIVLVVTLIADVRAVV